MAVTKIQGLADTPAGLVPVTVAFVGAQSSAMGQRLRVDVDQSNQLASGIPTFNREFLTTSQPTLTSGVVRYAFFTPHRDELVAAVRMMSGSTAAAATPTLVRFGLYTVNSVGDGTLVASTVSNTAIFAAANTVYRQALSAAYQILQGQRYAFAALVVTAATAPNVPGCNLGTSGAEVGEPPMVCAAMGAQADLPATFTAASLAPGNVNRIYAVLTP